MRLEGIRTINFYRLAQQWAVDFDRRQRIMDSIMWHLGDYIQADRPGRAVWNNLMENSQGPDVYVFDGRELLDENFDESDELIEGLWEVKEDLERQLGFDTRLLDDWAVEFRNPNPEERELAA